MAEGYQKVMKTKKRPQSDNLKNSRKHFVILIAFVLVLLGGFLLIERKIQFYYKSSEAAPNSTMTFTPSSATTGSGKSFNLAAIDDSTGKITKLKFAKNEGVAEVFHFWKEYLEAKSKPVAIYLDKFSTYKVNHKNATDNHELLTQFQRACNDLNINLISAHSPQAKGRVERLFETLQDRLVKELRLARISDAETANKFLEEKYIQIFNDKFAVIPAKDTDLHRPLTKYDKENIDKIFSIQSKRQVKNDFTIQFKNTWYQLAEIQPTTVYRKDDVLVEERLNGEVYLSKKEKYLNFKNLPARPEKVKTNLAAITPQKSNWIPPENHPWRKQIQASIQQAIIAKVPQV